MLSGLSLTAEYKLESNSVSDLQEFSIFLTMDSDYVNNSSDFNESHCSHEVNSSARAPGVISFTSYAYKNSIGEKKKYQCATFKYESTLSFIAEVKKKFIFWARILSHSCIFKLACANLMFLELISEGVFASLYFDGFYGLIFPAIHFVLHWILF